MEAHLNREIKAFCSDFAPVRDVLRQVGAGFVEVKDQVDFFYHLPVTAEERGTRRLKLRVEHGKAYIIYYYEHQEDGARTSHVQLWEVGNPIKEVLDAALGVRAVVRKSRELWRKDNVLFNLDTVEGVGQVFEVEVQVQVQDGRDADGQVEGFWRVFGPHLGQPIASSNEDLVGERSP